MSASCFSGSACGSTRTAALASCRWPTDTRAVSTALHSPNLDAPPRLRVLADGYGLSTQGRVQLPAAVERVTDVCRAFVARRVAEGDPAFVRALAERGGWDRWDRIQTWPADHRGEFTTALLRT